MNYSSTIAILALQGAFAEHQQMLSLLGAESVLIRNLNDWEEYINAPFKGKGVILPGGESTAMMKIMHDEGLFEPLRNAIKGGMPAFGTCAGMILLDDKHLDCMNITAKRNAYGRQLGSFHAEHEFKVSDNATEVIPMTFIRAPYIERLGEGVEVLSVLDEKVIAARQGNMLVTSFHPELTDDLTVHEMFLRSVTV